VSFLIAFAIALVLTPVARWVGAATGLVDVPSLTSPDARSDTLKIHRAPVSVLGGAAVTLATLIAPIVVGKGAAAGLVPAAAVALAVGLADDIRPLPPWTRIAGLGVAGILLAAGGSRFATAGGFGAVLVVLLVVVCANAVNLVDGQDGLAGGLAAIAALGLHFAGGARDPAVGLALAGALAAFLLWNRPPARVFLGNGGAYAIGVILAALAASVSNAEGGRGVVVSLLCLGIFALELVSTVVRRLMHRQPLASGDREHVYDLLARRLGSRARSTLVFLGLSAVAVAMASIVKVSPSVAGLALAVAVASAGATGVTLWAWGGVR
jgi:UDP-GlcNAc:undecaprenyl-phosphate GlcNAc-1-phosphate transferase